MYSNAIIAIIRALEGPVVDLDVGTAEHPKVVRVHYKPFKKMSQVISRCVQPDNSSPIVSRFNISIGGEEFFIAFDMLVQFVYLQDYQGPTSFVRNEFKSLLLHAQVYSLAKKLVVTRLSDLAMTKGKDDIEIIEQGVLMKHLGANSDANNDTRLHNARSILYEVVNVLYTSPLGRESDGKIDSFRVLIAKLSGKCFHNLITQAEFAELGDMFPAYVEDVVALVRGKQQSEEVKYSWGRAISEFRANS